MENPVAIANGPTFGERHFGAAEMGDQRRTRRLVQFQQLYRADPFYNWVGLDLRFTRIFVMFVWSVRRR